MKSKRKEATAIKKYIFYIISRVKLIKIEMVEVSDNQINYYESLYKAIKEYSKSHKLYMRYVLGKLTFEDVRKILGFADRDVFRYLAR